jgi:hypothetical protein
MATATKIAAIGLNALHSAPKTASRNIAKALVPNSVKASDTSAKHSTNQQKEIERKNDPASKSPSKTVNLCAAQISPDLSQQVIVDPIRQSVGVSQREGTREGKEVPQPSFDRLDVGQALSNSAMTSNGMPVSQSSPKDSSDTALSTEPSPLPLPLDRPNSGTDLPTVSPAAEQAMIATLDVAPAASGKIMDAKEHQAPTSFSETGDGSIREVLTDHTLTPSPRTVPSKQTTELISKPQANEAVLSIQNALVNAQPMVPGTRAMSHEVARGQANPEKVAGASSKISSHQDGDQTARTDLTSVLGIAPTPNHLAFAGPTGLGKDNVKKAADKSDDSPLNSPAGNEPTTAHPAADSPQADVSTQGAGDSSASQVVVLTVPLKAVSDDTALKSSVTAAHQNATLADPSRPDVANLRSGSGEPVMALGVNAAKIIQTIRESEMRVGMHSSEFGNISVRTSVSQQQLFTQISVDHSDLSRALTAQLPAMQARLGDASGLHTLIEINNLGSSFSSGTGHSSQGEPEQFRSSQRIERAISSRESEKSLNPVVLTAASSGQRLDIRA